MILKLAIAPSRSAATNFTGANIGRHPPDLSIRPPKLSVDRTSWRGQFLSSILALLQGPVPPKRFLGAPYFRDCWIEPRFPRGTFLAAVAIEALLIAFPPPIWNLPPHQRALPQQETQLTWYGPVQDLPAILPLTVTRKPSSKVQVEAPREESGREGFHPQQTIISAPLHPTHPRQTLIQPAAPPEPPKFLPALPNVVQLAEPALARPKLDLTAAAPPRAPVNRQAASADAPQIDITEKQLGPLDIAAVQNAAVQPAVPVTPMSAPKRAQQKALPNAAVPDVAASASIASSTFIALSATPAPVAPPSEPPAGNLSARIAVSPEDAADAGSGKSGVSGGKGIAGTVASAGGVGRHGPDDIFIGGENTANKGPSSGVGVSSLSASLAPREPSPVLPSKPLFRASVTPQEGKAAGDLPAATVSEPLLGSNRVYTLNVNMPNLTSASGSWVLNFAEMPAANETNDPLAKSSSIFAAGGEIAAPAPLRKVDPKYPPELRVGHVEGEVILYAIIRKDGTVDSIQLVRGIDPRLDANAMEALAQWKFQPAEKQGVPIDLEAVIHIPFRSRTITY